MTRLMTRRKPRSPTDDHLSLPTTLITQATFLPHPTFPITLDTVRNGEKGLNQRLAGLPTRSPSLP